MTVCECSADYGPCEQHCQVIAQREGASLRTADELALRYLDDALDIDPECLSVDGRETRRRAVVDLAAEREHGFSHWFSDPDLEDEMYFLVNQAESNLGILGYQTYRDDGYVIVKITGGPLEDQ